MMPALDSPQSKKATAPPLPGAYRWWLQVAESVLRPLMQMREPAAADLPITGPASNHGPSADRLESFARPCLWASHWLAAESTGEESLAREEVATWFRQGLLAGTNPEHRSYWGVTANYRHHTVEMAALVLSLEMAGEWLWQPLNPRERAQVANWLSSVRGVGLHRNNHLFFGVLPLSFLLKHGYGRPGDQKCVLRWMDIMERMQLGGGWFIDGSNETVDHYNAFAFHYYGLWWGQLYGTMDAGRTRRWRDWTREFLGDYVRFFSAQGEQVPFGRSMTYRFAVTAPFALAEKCGASPLSPGLSRRVCTKNLLFFLSREIGQGQGALSLGWTDEFPALAEPYSCAASPYWAAKGLSPLLLASTHSFWSDPEEPLPSETEDFSRPLPQIGMVVRSNGGEVELLNAATGISLGNTSFDACKWGKLSFRTGVGFEIKAKDGPCPMDASLVAESQDGLFFGRQATHPLDVEDHHISYVYALGGKPSAEGEFSVQAESHIWWKGGWQFHVHRYHAHQLSRLTLGGYSLAADDAAALREEGGFPFVRSDNGKRATALQALGGWQQAGQRLTLAGEKQRVHIYGPNSLTLFLQTDWVRGEGCLTALTWAGANNEPVRPWNIKGSYAGHLSLTHPSGGHWKISHEAIPVLSV